MSVPVGIPGVGPVTDDAGRTLPAVRAFNPFDTAGRDPSGPHRSDDAPPGRRSRALTERRAVRALAGLALPAILLGLWQWVTTTGRVPAYQLPTPESVWLAAIDLAERGLLGQYVAISTQRVLIGFAVGALLGLAVGALVGLSRVSDVLLAPALGAVRAVPSLAWVPLLLLWVGINEDSKLILIAIGAFFPVYTTVAGALRHVDPHLVEAGRAYGLSGPRLLARVQLPETARNRHPNGIDRATLADDRFQHHRPRLAPRPRSARILRADRAPRPRRRVNPPLTRRRRLHLRRLLGRTDVSHRHNDLRRRLRRQHAVVPNRLGRLRPRLGNGR